MKEGLLICSLSKDLQVLLILDVLRLFYVLFTEKGKASFSESDGVAILMKVLQESDDEKFVDLIFEIFSSVIVDGKLVLIINLN